MKKLMVMMFVLAAATAACSKNKKTTTPTNTGGSATEMKTDGDKPAGGDTAQKPAEGAGADPCAGPSK
jgi:hypothetical protein